MKQFKMKDFRSWSQAIGIGETARISCCDCGLVHLWEIRPAPLKSKYHYHLRVKVLPSNTAGLRASRKFECQPIVKEKTVRSPRRKRDAVDA